MSPRLKLCVLLLGVGIGCGGQAQRSQAAPEAPIADAGSANVTSNGSNNEQNSGSAGRPAGWDGGDKQADSGVISDSGVTSDSDAASVSEHFWNDDTQHIEIACFGFFAGLARLSADRAQLNAEQLALLTSAPGIPGDNHDGDDAIHCAVTTTDTAGTQRRFTIGEGPGYGSLIVTVPRGDDNYLSSVLGCEFRNPWPDADDPKSVPFAFSANPLCLHELWPPVGTSSYHLDLPLPGKAYTVELARCAERPGDPSKLELFGADPTTPLAVGVRPSTPGPDQACLVLEARVDAPLVGRLVFTSTREQDYLVVFR